MNPIHFLGRNQTTPSDGFWDMYQLTDQLTNVFNNKSKQTVGWRISTWARARPLQGIRTAGLLIAFLIWLHILAWLPLINNTNTMWQLRVQHLLGRKHFVRWEAGVLISQIFFRQGKTICILCNYWDRRREHDITSLKVTNTRIPYVFGGWFWAEALMQSSFHVSVENNDGKPIRGAIILAVMFLAMAAFQVCHCYHGFYTVNQSPKEISWTMIAYFWTKMGSSFF